MVKRRRLELPRHNCHYPLKVARLPIPPPLRVICIFLVCPEQDSNLHVVKHTHLKRARLPIPPPGQLALRKQSFLSLSGKRDLNPRPQPWQGCALPTELLPHCEMLSEEAFLICGCKGSNIFRTTKTFQGKSEKNAFFLLEKCIFALIHALYIVVWTVFAQNFKFVRCFMNHSQSRV